MIRECTELNANLNTVQPVPVDVPQLESSVPNGVMFDGPISNTRSKSELVTRIFLAIVGAAYVVLAVWCSLLPEPTSKSVGFTLQRGSGQSEFLTVYGGLEFALGFAFLWPLYRPAESAFPLLLCLWIHGCLVAFRAVSFVLYREIPATTCVLAAVEWAIFLGSAFFYFAKR